MANLPVIVDFDIKKTIISFLATKKSYTTKIAYNHH